MDKPLEKFISTWLGECITVVNTCQSTHASGRWKLLLFNWSNFDDQQREHILQDHAGGFNFPSIGPEGVEFAVGKASIPFGLLGIAFEEVPNPMQQPNYFAWQITQSDGILFFETNTGKIWHWENEMAGTTTEPTLYAASLDQLKVTKAAEGHFYQE